MIHRLLLSAKSVVSRTCQVRVWCKQIAKKARHIALCAEPRTVVVCDDVIPMGDADNNDRLSPSQDEVVGIGLATANAGLALDLLGLLPVVINQC